MIQSPFSLTFVTDDHIPIADLLLIVEEAIRGGVTAVQLRRKLTPVSVLVAEATSLLSLLRPLNIPLIINDHIHVAHVTCADGVHLGQTDDSIHEARTTLGPHALIGISVSSMQEAKKAEALDVAYIGAGPVFPTSTKHDASPPLGISILQNINHFSRHPVVAIGGITLENAASVVATNCAGIAVVSAICYAPSPFRAACAFKKILQREAL